MFFRCQPAGSGKLLKNVKQLNHFIMNTNEKKEEKVYVAPRATSNEIDAEGVLLSASVNGESLKLTVGGTFDW